jgi:hypothetical protein
MNDGQLGGRSTQIGSICDSKSPAILEYHWLTATPKAMSRIIESSRGGQRRAGALPMPPGRVTDMDGRDQAENSSVGQDIVTEDVHFHWALWRCRLLCQRGLG